MCEPLVVASHGPRRCHTAAPAPSTSNISVPSVHDRWTYQPLEWNMHPRLLLLFVGAVLLRVGSVAVSKRNEKALKAQGAKEYGRSTSHLLAAAHTLFYSGTLVEGLWRRTQPTPWTTVGLLLYALGILALVLVWRELQGLWTVKLLIASDHRLNQSALFRWIRHPNYFLNIIPELTGLALIMGAWLVLVVGLPLYLLVLRKRIVQEEQVMYERFPHYAPRRFSPRAQDTTRGPPSS